MHQRRAEELRWRKAAALERLCQEEQRMRDHIVSQRAVALHGVLARQRKERNTVMIHRRKQNSHLETEFLEEVEMTAHDAYASAPGAAGCGFLPQLRRGYLYTMWREEQEAVAQRCEAALHSSEGAIWQSFEGRMRDEEELALLADALLEVQQMADASHKRAATRSAEYIAALQLLEAMQEGDQGLQAVVHKLQATVQQRRRVAAEAEVQCTALEDAHREREAQREERDTAREEAIALHKRVRSTPPIAGWQEKRTLTPDDIAKLVAYLSVWRTGGRRPATKPKSPKSIVLEGAPSAAAAVLQNLPT
eukprot:GGOE01058131.1.p1 GENE.GGOE01058131.1~~GGOE01058131.1.p1  ORF type:complete len:307 (+),score=93.88 GGOE01058131.1:498-1418(+)